MREDLVAVGDFFSTVEAQLARGRLEEEGIPAIVAGAATGTMLMGMGVETVRLQVPRADVERARAILAALAEEPPLTAADVAAAPGPPDPQGWAYCPGCGSEVSTALAACPACGAAVPARKAEEAAALLRGPAGTRPAADEEEEPKLSPNDDLAERAWRAALYGCVTLPVLFHLVSFWMLVKLLFTPGEVSGPYLPKAGGAFLIDMAVFGLVALLIRVTTF